MLAYVDDNSSAPHIQTPVVALVPEHLWSQVCRRSNHTLAEAFLADDPGESEITKLDLKAESSVQLNRSNLVGRGFDSAAFRFREIYF